MQLRSLLCSPPERTRLSGVSDAAEKLAVFSLQATWDCLQCLLMHLHNISPQGYSRLSAMSADAPENLVVFLLRGVRDCL